MNGIHQTVRGRFRAQVIGPGDLIIRDYGWQDNLILNQGMDGIAGRLWADSFLYACLGTGSDVNFIPSGATTAQQSNVTVTLSGGSLRFTDTPTDAGRMLIWDDGQRAKNVAVTNPTTATVSDSKLVTPAQTFRYFLTTLTGLQTETVRTGDISSRAGYNITTTSLPGTVTMQRTWEFPQEVTQQIYTEVGVSWSATPGNNLFSRMLPSPAITIDAGFHLRLSYQLILTLSPTSPLSKTVNVQGWPLSPIPNTAGSECLEDWGLAMVDTDGITRPMRTVNNIGIVANEPSAICDALFSQNASAFSSLGSAPLNRWSGTSFSKAAVVDIYTAMSYQNTKTVRAYGGEANMTGMKSVAIGHLVEPSNFLPTLTFIFTNGQTKTAPNILRLSYKFIWSRIFA